MCHGKFHAVAFAKAEGFTEVFLFFVNDDRREGFFGMLRVIECGRNDNLLEFEERASRLMRVDNNKSEMSKLFATHRRLSGHFFLSL